MEVLKLKHSCWEAQGALPEGGQALLHKVREILPPYRPGVLKQLRDDAQSDPLPARWLAREIRVQQAVHGRGVAAVYDYGQTPRGTPCFVQEHLDGVTLAEALRRQPQGFRKDVLLHIAISMACILHRIHSAGIIHRDVTTRNAIWTAVGHIYLIDFGIALWNRYPDSGDDRVRAGTRPYLAPEAIVGRCCPQSDIYSLGACLYETATGRASFEHHDEAALDRLILTAAPTPPSRLRPDLNPGMEAIILRCLAKHPENRFASASDLAGALNGLSPQNLSVPLLCPECGEPRLGDYCACCGFSFQARAPYFGDGALLVAVGPRAGAPLLLDHQASLTLGRREINPTDPDISRQHLLLERDATGWAATAIGRNGAELNSQPLQTKTRLHAGDVLLCGSTRIRFVGKP